MNQIADNELFRVQDSSKIQNFMECARAYFYRHVLGWSYEEVSLHLEYGNAWHLAMEVLLDQKERGHPYSVDSMEEAYTAFEKHWRGLFTAEDELTFGPRVKKTLANAEVGLEEYIVTYASSDLDWEVLWTEIAGKVDIGMNWPVYFKCDAIVESLNGDITVLEHKTGSLPSRAWVDQWSQKTQIGTYLHMANCLFAAKNASLTVNGFFPQNPQRLKKDGTPYAGDTKQPTLLRVPVIRTMEMMNDWLYTTQCWMSQIQKNFVLLYEAKESDPVMTAFPKNPQHCSNYFGCPYRDYCSSHANPLKHLGELPMGYTIEFWDPRRFAEKAHKIVEV